MTNGRFWCTAGVLSVAVTTWVGCTQQEPVKKQSKPVVRATLDLGEPTPVEHEHSVAREQLIWYPGPLPTEEHWKQYWTSITNLLPSVCSSGSLAYSIVQDEPCEGEMLVIVGRAYSSLLQANVVPLRGHEHRKCLIP